jgi:hypothetical protein
LSWLKPLFTTKESQLIEKIGLDATVFLRCARMLRNIFAVLSIIGCGILIPINVVAYNKDPVEKPPDGTDRIDTGFKMMTPVFLYKAPELVWAYIVVAWLFDIVICFFLWSNYRVVARLRQQYLESPEYRNSLHARTLMIIDIPKELRTDDGITRIVEGAGGSRETPRAAIARNVKDLPELVEEYEHAVKQLEKVLAKYLKNPDKLPAARPLCKPSSKDKAYNKGQKVDAIEYLTTRIKHLEMEIMQVRETVDKRNALPFGFASFQDIAEAHAVAYATRKKAPQGTTITLATKPDDLIWKNLQLMKSDRRWRTLVNAMWIALLTIVFIVPNILIVVFLANLSNLAAVWPAFRQTYVANDKFWSAVQGILAPAITFFIYLYLPSIFRRIRVKAGDVTKTSRERHVTGALFSFFTFNQLIGFSLFATAWAYIIELSNKEDITKTNFGSRVIVQMSSMSAYWVSYLLQRNLGMTIDLVQLLRLTYGSFERRFLSPTPREQVMASAPQPFEYASYYNYLLFYSAVAFTMATIQPVVLLIVAIYFSFDCFVKKYMLMYIFITKNESGGMFWRSIFNRVLVFTLLGNALVILIVLQLPFYWAHWQKLAALAPLPILITAFKFYCVRTFDNGMHFYEQGHPLKDPEHMGGHEKKKAIKRDKVGVRFGNPVLYKPLITPMVSSKSQHLLKSIYSGRTSVDVAQLRAGGYSDVYMDPMDPRQPGKGASSPSAPFEIVNEHEMDFEHFKNRAEFSDAAGGNGALFGHAADIIRPGTPSSTMTGLTRTTTMDSSLDDFHHMRKDSNGSSSAGYHSRGGSNPNFIPGGKYSHMRDDSNATSLGRSRSGSRGSDTTRVGGGTEYPRGYHQTPSALREHSPAPSQDGGVAGFRPDLSRAASREVLVSSAADMGRVPMRVPLPTSAMNPASQYGQQPPQHHPQQYNHLYATGPYADSPGITPLSDGAGAPGGADDTSYEYFRRGRMSER